MATARQVVAKAVAEYPCLWNDLSARHYAKPNLENNQIHLWMLSLDGLMVRETSSENSSSAIRFVSPFAPHLSEPLTVADHVRAQRIIDNARRKHYLGGRAGLRILLSAYTHIAHADLEFGYGSRGKPSLLNPLADGKLAFNYTLSGGYALYAFARNREVGVDLEVFPRTIATRRLAKRILTQGEQTAWNAIDKPQQNHAMLACWTRKEAYGKVLGVGIRYTMNQVNLFTDLQCARWRTEVSGLFDQQAARSTLSSKLPSKPQLHGVQLELPIAGVASLMYAEHGERAGHEVMGNEPVLSAFQLHL